MGVAQLQDIDKWINLKSLEYCPPAANLPPCPALGLAWTAMANDANSIDLPNSKAIHSLVNSITVINVNKTASSKKIPVPAVPGIRAPSQVSIWPRSNQDSVILSKVLIKDHPQREHIVALAKEIQAGEPKHLRKGKNA